MAIRQSNFKTISQRIKLDYSKKVSHMDVVLEINDVGKDPLSESTTEPAIHITDIMLQGGTVATSWVGHVSEIRWSFDTA